MKKAWFIYVVGGLVIVFVSFSELPAEMTIREGLILLILLLWFVAWSLWFGLERTTEVSSDTLWEKAFLSASRAVGIMQKEAYAENTCVLLIVQPKTPELSIFPKGDLPPSSGEHVIMAMTKNVLMPDIGILLHKFPIFRTTDLIERVNASRGDCIIVWFLPEYAVDPVFGLKPQYTADPFLGIAIKRKLVQA